MGCIPLSSYLSVTSATRISILWYSGLLFACPIFLSSEVDRVPDEAVVVEEEGLFGVEVTVSEDQALS